MLRQLLAEKRSQIERIQLQALRSQDRDELLRLDGQLDLLEAEVNALLRRYHQASC